MYGVDPEWTPALTPSGPNVIEDRMPGSTAAQYVWGMMYANQLVLRDDNYSSSGSLGASGSGLGRRLYVQQDSNWNVTALVDAGGNVVRHFRYDPYGQAAMLQPDYSGGASGGDLYWMYTFQGGRSDSAGYRFGVRDYNPALQRWMEQDPAGYAASGANLYQAMGDSPVANLDPFGTITLGKKISALMSMRGVMNFSNWLIDKDKTVILNDDEDEMTPLNAVQMDVFYKWFVKSHSGELKKNHWTFISTMGDISAQRAVGPFNTGGGSFGTAAWWLGGAHDVIAMGHLMAGCFGGSVWIRAVDFHWDWLDVISGNEFGRNNGNRQLNRTVWLLEGGYHWVFDVGMHMATPIDVRWRDKRWWDLRGHFLYYCR